MSIRLIHVGDVHLSDTPPGYRTESYREDVLAKLRWCAEYAASVRADALLFAGDIFHSTRRVSHRLIADFYDTVVKSNTRVMVLPGNHDMVENVLSEIPGLPLGLLDRMPGISVEKDPDHTLLFSDGAFGTGASGIPTRVRIHPRPYVQGMKPPVVRDPDPDVHEVLWVHYGITPRPMPYHTHVIGSWDPQADLVLSGHVHDDLGMVYDLGHNTTYVNLGSISRGSLTEDNLSREVYVADITFDAKDFNVRRVAVPVRPSGEVFRVDEKLAERHGEEVATEFISRLGEARLAAFSVEDVRRRIQESEAAKADPAAAELALRCLDEVTR